MRATKYMRFSVGRLDDEDKGFGNEVSESALLQLETGRGDEDREVAFVQLDQVTAASKIIQKNSGCNVLSWFTFDEMGQTFYGKQLDKKKVNVQSGLKGKFYRLSRGASIVLRCCLACNFSLESLHD